MTGQSQNVLEINDLYVAAGDLKAVRGVTLSIPAGGRVGIVGESGAGKSLTALAVMSLLPHGWSAKGRIYHDGVDLLGLSERALTARRGRTLSMVFQDPLSALNPTQRIGKQITAVIRRHSGASKTSAYGQALELLASLRLFRPETLLRSFPHQLSGGQRQRVVIALALACYPKLVIADEPTTALDVTAQKEVLRVLDSAVRDRGCALLMITHNLPVIATMCDSVAVMYAGRVVEAGPVAEVFTAPRHQYTAALLRAQPTMDNIALDGSSRLPSIPGSVPSIAEIPDGCAFRPRCVESSSLCEAIPAMEGDRHTSACWHPVRLDQLTREH